MSAGICFSVAAYFILWPRRTRPFCACRACGMSQRPHLTFTMAAHGTLEEAVRKMGVSQLNVTLTDHQIKAIVAFLRSLTGQYRGSQVGGEP